MTEILAYCGAPPVPGEATWNTDPWLLVGLSVAAVAYFLASHRLDPRRRAAFAAGWALAALALISPLCHLSVALFSARVAQHMLLILVAAPLVAAGLGPFSRSGAAGRGAGAAALFAVLLWIWHLPGPYDATLRSDAVYWIMHLTLFAGAVGLWRGLFDTADSPGTAIVLGFGTAAQMSLISALLTLAPRPLFEVHSATTLAWGLTPLEDQQLGGLVMWVPGGTLFAAIALGAFARWLSRGEGRTTA